MKRTIITVTTLLLASSRFGRAQYQDNLANADISDMVLDEEFSLHRRLVNATQAKAKAEEKKADGDGDDDGDSTEGAPDESSMAGDEEDELQDK